MRKAHIRQQRKRWLTFAGHSHGTDEWDYLVLFVSFRSVCVCRGDMSCNVAMCIFELSQLLMGTSSCTSTVLLFKAMNSSCRKCILEMTRQILSHWKWLFIQGVWWFWIRMLWCWAVWYSHLAWRDAFIFCRRVKRGEKKCELFSVALFSMQARVRAHKERWWF